MSILDQVREKYGTPKTDDDVWSFRPRHFPGCMHFGSGLLLSVDTSGIKRQNLAYSLNGNVRNVSLGCFPEISTEAALELRARVRRFVDNGADPYNLVNAWVIEASMTPKRLKELERDITSVTRKVYDSLKIEQTMTVAEIVGALKKTAGANIDPKSANHCLAALVEKGVAVEPKRGEFKRVPPNKTWADLAPAESPKQEAQMPEAPKAITPAAPEKPSDAIRRLCLEVVDKMGQIELHAIAMDEEVKKTDANAKEAKQLISLLQKFSATASA